MKSAHCFLLLATMGFNSVVMASAVTPSVTGTVTRMVPVGNTKQVTVNGHTYTLDANTKSDNATAQLHTGQTVTMLLSANGQTVMMVHSANSNATHP